jgi:drug/metabolite transporter (DMT)-like permease
MAYFLLILLGAIWGASYLFIKIGGETVPPVTLVMMRTTIAAIVLFFAIKLRREPLPPRNAPIWKWFAIVALINTVIPYTLITWGEHYISSGLAAILIAAMPIFTVIFAHFMTHDEKITPRKVVGILAGFIGVVILFLPDLGGGEQLYLAGGLAVLIAAVSYALATIFARRHFKGTSPTIASFGQMGMSSLVLIPASLLLDKPWTLSPSAASLSSIFTLAILGTAIAYLIYFWLIAHLGATRTSLTTYVSPVVALFLGWLVLGEMLHWSMLAGLVLIVAGVGLVTNLQLSLGGAVKPNSGSVSPLEADKAMGD